jgi:hypothetical protein
MRTGNISINMLVPFISVTTASKAEQFGSTNQVREFRLRKKFVSSLMILLNKQMDEFKVPSLRMPGWGSFAHRPSQSPKNS